MKIQKVNYFEYQLNQELIEKFSKSFVEKYNCIAYTYIDDSVLVLLNSNFSFYNLSKINYFIKEPIILAYINNDDWNNIAKLSHISSARNDALFKYQIDKTEPIETTIRESVTDFYNVEIKNAPIVKIVDSLIAEAITMRASDIHLEPMENKIIVRYRINGKLINRPDIPLELLSEISTRIKVLSSLDITKKLLPQDGKLKFKVNDRELDIRVSILPTIYGERFAMRILDITVGGFTINDIGFNDEEYEEVNNLITSASGMILVVGPTGSGKSTTLHSFLMKNQEKNENIITVEDPVEYTIDGVNQVQINEESGLDFATTLRTILRQDPNIIMIGEIRDYETAQIACRAAITGHLVYSTLHTNSSVGVINRLIDMKVEPYLLIDSIKGIISQRLVRILCPNCKIKFKATELEKMFLKEEGDIEIFKPCGCGLCNMTGYTGRKPLYEILTIDDSFRDLISSNAPINKYWKLVEKKNIKKLFDKGKALILEGETTIEEIQSILD